MPMDWAAYDAYFWRKDASQLAPEHLELVRTVLRGAEGRPAASDVSERRPTPAAAADGAAAAAEAAADGAAAEAAAEGPRYPKSFQEVCEMLQRGEPLPGVRDIPNTLSALPPTPPTLAPRRKPWEK